MLTAIALLLLAGVIFYNVLSSPSKSGSEAAFHDENNAQSTVTESVKSENTDKTQETLSYTEETSEESDTSQEESSKNLQAETGKININTADAELLMTLNGIGSVKANAIVEYRERFGAFATVNALTAVPGIGEKTLEKIIDDITV